MQIKDLPLKSRADLAITQVDDTIPKTAAMLSSLNIGALPVCDPSGKIIGILSERDIVRGVSENAADLNNLTVADLMTAKVMTCNLDDDTEKVMEIMRKNGFRHLPVLDDDRLISIVSSRDIMAAVLGETKTNFKNMGLAYEMVR